MIVNYKEMEDESLHLSTSFEFTDSEDAIVVKDFEGELFKTGKGYYLKGHLTGEFRTVCDRCAEPALMNLDMDISVNIEPASAEGAEAEYEMQDEDGEVFRSEPDSLDLHELLRQEVILQLPVKRLCSEDCKGLTEFADSEDDTAPLKGLEALKNLKK